MLIKRKDEWIIINMMMSLEPKYSCMNRYVEKTDPWSSHSVIYSWMNNFQPGSHILDVGTANGILGRKYIGRGYYLTGVENNLEFAKQARPYYDDFLCANIQDASIELISNQDVVVCADILEHLPDPQNVLNLLVALQKPGSHFLISVPNIANIWIRLNLLFGKFDYSENGILDNTHLRFFTRRTFTRLLQNSDLVIKELVVTPIPLNRLSEFFVQNRFGKYLFSLLALVTRLFPSLLGYQFVANTIRLPKGKSNG